MTIRNAESREKSSFRDPSGYLYYRDGILYRKITPLGKHDYYSLMKSGLYDELTGQGYLIQHEEIPRQDDQSEDQGEIIKPEVIGFISYPYEWCFSELKAAALLTLKIQEIALSRRMSLKDASAYNIQFFNGQPILIDTLSFERYQEGEPWTAYRQFCQHFLAPLSLMAYRDVRLNQLLRIYLDGIPLDLTSRLLPARTYLNLPLLFHIHLHARSQLQFQNKTLRKETFSRKMGIQQLLGLIQNLKSGVQNLKWEMGSTPWSKYEKFHSYTPAAFEEKSILVQKAIEISRPKIVWDLGANTGFFSRLASNRGIPTISFDSDPGAVELNYQSLLRDGDKNLLPLILDLTNPSPDAGWQLQERRSLIDRGPADLVLALALIHHLAIGNNIPFLSLAQFFSTICDWLLIEFVPKDDPQVRKIMGVRKDIFTDYNQDHFEKDFNIYFRTVTHHPIRDSQRVIYLMQRIQT